ncbi:MAG: hypothetical protein WEC33_06325 [Dehalococcoidia bacterium]
MPATRADDSYVGKYIGRHEYLVDAALVDRYISGTRDDNPWYRGESPFGGPVAPALLLHSEQYAFRLGDWYLPNLYGNLHIRQEWDLFQPVMLGEAISTHGMIIDRYIRKDRDVVVLEFSIFNQAGVMAARGRCHQSFLREVDESDPVVDRARAPRPRPGDDAEEPIELLEPLTRVADAELCLAFSGPGRNYHNDAAEARKLGFPEVVVQGTMSTTFLSDVMTRRFGAGWFAGGRMSVNLVNVLWGGETVTARAAIRQLLPEGARRRAICDVWTEKPDGTRTLAGTASALL